MPVYAVAVDLCASGGYYIAVAADKIYADKGSLVGSIGVRMDGFGFQKAMEDLGVERRLLTAGDHKGILDPFSPLKEQDRAFVQTLLDQLHGQFISVVKEGRGDRLKGGDEVFSGLFWSGEQAVDLGLVDGLGSSGSVARDQIGAETIVDYTKKKDLLASLHRALWDQSGRCPAAGVGCNPATRRAGDPAALIGCRAAMTREPPSHDPWHSFLRSDGGRQGVPRPRDCGPTAATGCWICVRPRVGWGCRGGCGVRLVLHRSSLLPESA